MNLQVEVMDDFNGDKSFSDRLIPEIQNVLGKVFFRVAPIEEDMKRNTDLIVFHSGNFRISARVRRYNYFLKYPNDFTVRSTRKSGAKTEIDKIMYGWGDYFFYGFADKDNKHLHAYGIGSLKVFRRVFWDFFREHRKFLGKEEYVEKNSCYFRAFKWELFPKEILIASHNLEINFKDSMDINKDRLCK